jgi:hypothetical protein
VKAGDLAAALATLPAAWAAVLPGWTDARLRSVQEAVVAVSGDRPIAPDDPLRALRLVDPDAVKVVVIGQDPYPTAGHADGLAFSAGRGKPRSLARVFELLAEARPGFVAPEKWSLDDWARQGVLLLNPVMSVEIGRSGSHLDCGWWRSPRDGQLPEPPSVAAGVSVVGIEGARLLGRREGRRLARPGADDAAPVLRLRPLVHGGGQPFRRHGSPSRLVGDRPIAPRRATVPGSSRRGARVAKGGRL